MKIKALTHVRLFASPEHWVAARAFYDLVLGLKQEFSDEENGVAMFGVGDVHLLLERVDPRDPEAAALAGRFAGISLRVDSAEQARARLEELEIALTGGPEKQPWGDTLLHVRDPAGNVITLIEFGAAG